MDGSHVTTSVISLLPTSRGSVTLSSADPAATPCIDPNYYADRYVMRTGLKKTMEILLDIKEGRAFIESETTAEGQSILSSQFSDSGLAECIKERGK